jgi:hypothetical protein
MQFQPWSNILLCAVNHLLWHFYGNRLCGGLKYCADVQQSLFCQLMVDIKTFQSSLSVIHLVKMILTLVTSYSTHGYVTFIW